MTLEEQKEIEAVFIASWDWWERFYAEQIYHFDRPVYADLLAFITLLRKRGYDRQLCMGITEDPPVLISLYRVAYCTVNSQPRLDFDWREYNKLEVWLIAPEVSVMYSFDRIEMTPKLEELFTVLLAYPL
jgi:hypothetical protein